MVGKILKVNNDTIEDENISTFRESIEFEEKATHSNSI